MSKETREKVANAFRAMKSIGISEDKVKPVLKSLLNLFDKNWELIEEENYRALADAIFERDEVENGDVAGCVESSHLGLNLEISQSFLDLVYKNLSKGKQADFSSHQKNGPYHNKRPKAKFDASSRSSQQKLKTSSFAAVLLKIGSWQKQSMHEGDLMAKLYYANRRMVWEILGGALKSKIEIQWSDITAIRAVMADTDEPGMLEIQLNKPPSFFREANPEPRRHTAWIPVSDFTGGQATIVRSHLVVFPPRVLDRHYEQLLKCDERLFALSRVPFPNQECPFVDSNMFGLPQFPLSLNEHELGVKSMFKPTPNTIEPAVDNPSQPVDNNPTIWDQGIDFPVIAAGNPSQPVDNNPTVWDEGIDFPVIAAGNVPSQLMDNNPTVWDQRIDFPAMDNPSQPVDNNPTVWDQEIDFPVIAVDNPSQPVDNNPTIWDQGIDFPVIAVDNYSQPVDNNPTIWDQEIDFPVIAMDNHSQPVDNNPAVWDQGIDFPVIAADNPSQPVDYYPTVWDQGIDFPEGNIGVQEIVQGMNQWPVDISSRTQGHELISSQVYETTLSKLDDSENDLLGNNGQVPCSNEGTIAAELEAMIQSYLDPTDVDIYGNILIDTYPNCDITDNNLEWFPSNCDIMDNNLEWFPSFAPN